MSDQGSIMDVCKNLAKLKVKVQLRRDTFETFDVTWWFMRFCFTLEMESFSTCPKRLPKSSKCRHKFSTDSRTSFKSCFGSAKIGIKPVRSQGRGCTSHTDHHVLESYLWLSDNWIVLRHRLKRSRRKIHDSCYLLGETDRTYSQGKQS